MKKPFMKKEDLDDEYIKVSANETCHIPLKQATKLLNLKPGDLPTIKMFAKDLTKTIEFIENERATDLLEYQNHIFLIRERLIPQDYLKVKDKLKSQFKPSSPKSKDQDVSLFTNNCIFLELDHMGTKLKWAPMVLGEGEIIGGQTLH